MSINAVNGFNNFQYGANQVDPIKPETRQKLRELNIDEKSVKNEAQAQVKINEKEEQFRKEMREFLQAQASTQQQAQASSQIQQPQQVQGIDKAEKVEGIKESQQVKQPEGIEQQHAVNNQQQGDEQIKAFAASQQKIDALPFEKGSELVAMYNKFKLGLI
jgi:hypothetical protein